MSRSWSMRHLTVTEQFRREQFNDLLQLVLKFLETYSRDELRNRVFYLSQLQE